MGVFTPGEANEALRALGERLRQARLSRNERQAVFAQRLRISVPTLRSMERGDPTTRVGHWATALWMFDRIGDLDGLFARRRDLFAEALEERRSAGKARRRARGSTK